MHQEVILYHIVIIHAVFPELPTADDRDRVPDPLENPPDSAEVGRDIRAATMSRQEEFLSGMC